MLSSVNRLGIAVSGGADSLTLLDGLAALPLDVEFVPIHLLQHPNSQDPDALTGFINDRYGLQTYVIEADTSDIAARLIRNGKAPCRACAPLRAEKLGKASQALGLDALALGHHLDDATATLLMNIFHGRGIDTMRPIARRRGNLATPILRPLLLTPERSVKLASPTGPNGLFDCGVCSLHATERARVTAFVRETFDAHGPASHFAAEVITGLASPRSR